MEIVEPPRRQDAKIAKFRLKKKSILVLVDLSETV